MSCEKLVLIHQYLRNELKETEHIEMVKHIEICSECQKEAEEFGLVREKLKMIESIEPSGNFVNRVMIEVEECGEEMMKSKRSFWRIIAESFGLPGSVPAWAISSAFHIILFAFFSFFFYNTYKKEAKEEIRKQEPIDLTEYVRMPNFSPSTEKGLEDEEIQEFVRAIESDYEKDKQWLSRFIENRNHIADRLTKLLEDEPDNNKLYLLQIISSLQKDDGNWESDRRMVVAYTALASFSLQMAGANSKSVENLQLFKSIEKANRFILSKKTENGLFSTTIDFDLFNHIFACLMLTDNYIIMEMNNSNIIQEALDKLVKNQNADGSWCYSSSNGGYLPRETGSLIPTIWAVFTLKLAISSPDLRDSEKITSLARALVWIKSYKETQMPLISVKETRYFLKQSAISFASALVTPLLAPVDLRNNLKTLAKCELYDKSSLSIGNDFNTVIIAMFAVQSTIKNQDTKLGAEFSDEEKNKLIEWQRKTNEQLTNIINTSKLQRKKLIGDCWSRYGGEIYNASMLSLILSIQEALPL